MKAYHFRTFKYFKYHPLRSWLKREKHCIVPSLSAWTAWTVIHNKRTTAMKLFIATSALTVMSAESAEAPRPVFSYSKKLHMAVCVFYSFSVSSLFDYIVDSCYFNNFLVEAFFSHSFHPLYAKNLKYIIRK